MSVNNIPLRECLTVRDFINKIIKSDRFVFKEVCLFLFGENIISAPQKGS